MKKLLMAIGLFILLPLRAAGQDAICIVDGARVPPNVCAGAQGAPQDPLAQFLFPPELVMANQQAINLTERQRGAIQKVLKDAQGNFIDLQFRMSGEVEKLQRLLQGTTVDEAKVLEQVDHVLDVEREVKHTQLSLMIRVKNQLSAEQQEALARMRRPRG